MREGGIRGFKKVAIIVELDAMKEHSLPLGVRTLVSWKVLAIYTTCTGAYCPKNV